MLGIDTGVFLLCWRICRLYFGFQVYRCTHTYIGSIIHYAYAIVYCKCMCLLVKNLHWLIRVCFIWIDFLCTEMYSEFVTRPEMICGWLCEYIAIYNLALLFCSCSYVQHYFKSVKIILLYTIFLMKVMHYKCTVHKKLEKVQILIQT